MVANPIASPTVTTTYTVRISGDCGTPVDSATATITICVPPALTGPADQTVTSGHTATLSSPPTRP